MSKQSGAQRAEVGTIRVPGGWLYYEVRGAGPAVVLIHSAITDLRVWDREFEEYSANRRVVRYDVRGFGRSSPASTQYSDADDLRRLLRTLSIDSATLIAASHSGQIALDFAFRWPRRARSLVLVSSGLGLFDPRSSRSARLDAQDLERRFGTLAKAWNAGRLERCLDYLVKLFAPAQSERCRWRVRELMRDNLTEIVTDRSARHATFEVTDRTVGAVTAPVLVLWGSRDPAIVRWSSDQLRRALPHVSSRKIAGADHVANLSRPAAFDREVLRFLAGATGAARGAAPTPAGSDHRPGGSGRFPHFRQTGAGHSTLRASRRPARGGRR